MVNSSDLLVLFLLPHFVVVLLFDAPSHKATLKVFAYLLVSCQNLYYGHSHNTVVMDVPEIIGLYNVKSILTDISI